MLKNQSRFDLSVVALLGAIALACAWIYRNFAQDDAFITYRYARNIASGYGFVYNLHEAAFGTTTPLYTLVLALIGKFSGQEIHLVSHWVSILSLWISGVVLYSLGKSNRILSAAVALIFMSNPLLVSSKGMETFFLILLLLSALKCYIDGRFTLAGILLGLLVLTRYETILFVGLLGLHFLIRYRRIPVWMTTTVVLLLIWMVYAWYTFGHVIPQSAVAKLIAARIPFTTGALVWWRLYTDQTAWYNVFIPLVLLGIYAAWRNKLREQAYALLLAWSGIYFAAASLYAGSFPWYYAPLIPGFSILVVWGIGFLMSVFSTLLNRSRISERSIQALSFVALTVMASSLMGLQLSSWTRGWVNHQDQIVDARFLGYREAAEWLNRYASDGNSLATAEIGVLGYYTNMKIIDLYGLVTPGLTPWLADGLAETTRKTIEIYAPDYMLIRDDEALIELIEQSSHYRPVQNFAGNTLYKKEP